jgi:glutathione S-transferase
MRLHDYAPSGNCFKARLLLALLGRPYERVAVDLFAGDTLTDAFAALNPVRETPVLELDDGTVVTQSPAILWLLAEGTPFLPDTPLGRAQVVQWLAFEQERVMTGIGGARFHLVTGRATAEDPLVAGRLRTGARGARRPRRAPRRPRLARRRPHDDRRRGRLRLHEPGGRDRPGPRWVAAGRRLARSRPRAARLRRRLRPVPAERAGRRGRVHLRLNVMKEGLSGGTLGVFTQERL